MPSIQVRPFRRSDRDQLTELVNAHAQAVVPGLGVSVAAVLNSLEREPSEHIIDPWVRERMTLVAEQQARVVAAAHLRLYYADERASESYRGLGEIRWLLFWPQAPASGNPYWKDGSEAAGMLIAACLRQLEQWGAVRQYADGSVPVRGVWGVPEQWPHVRALYERAGFEHTGDIGITYLARVQDLACPAGPPVTGLSVRRSVGINGTRLSAILDEHEIGYIELEIFDEGERLPRHGGWADVGNFHVTERYRRRGVATWLLGQAARWLRLAQVERLLDYSTLEPDEDTGRDDAGYRAFLATAGFLELSRTRRGWTRAGRTQP
jgi:GNAT superfamily N-acetyltransferase